MRLTASAQLDRALRAAARRLARLERDRGLLATARELERSGLVVGTVGNVSVREGDHVRVTPTQLAYAGMGRGDLVTVDLDGRRVEGRRMPSRELAMHLAIYRARRDVHAIVHAHGTYAAAWSFLGVPLTPRIEETRYYDIGDVAVSQPAAPGSDALGAAAAAALGTGAAALLGGHGLVAVGADVERALLIARVVEHHARIAWLLRNDAVAEPSADARTQTPGHPLGEPFGRHAHTGAQASRGHPRIRYPR